LDLKGLEVGKYSIKYSLLTFNRVKTANETNMFANQTQPRLRAQRRYSPMNLAYERGEAKIANMEFHPTVTDKMFTDEKIF